MVELFRQASTNAVSLSVFFLSAAIFLAAFGWACIQVVRASQLIIATNVTISRELAAIQQMLTKAPAPTGFTPANVPVPGPPFMQPSPEVVAEAGKKPSKPLKMEGEFYAYDEGLQADLETIRNLRKERENDQGGLSDEELFAQIEKVQAAGFDENEP